MRKFCNVVYSLIVDDADGMVNKSEVRQKIDEALERMAPDPEKWGVGPKAAQEQANLMKAFGG
ncbi:MAG: hypothetical protein ACR2M4_03205 [Actinomycetota bacterium]